jgi:alanine racemase
VPVLKANGYGYDGYRRGILVWDANLCRRCRSAIAAESGARRHLSFFPPPCRTQRAIVAYDVSRLPHLEMVEALARAATKSGATAGACQNRYRMGRVGIRPDEGEFSSIAVKATRLEVRGLMSHFPRRRAGPELFHRPDRALSTGCRIDRAAHQNHHMVISAALSPARRH